MGNVRLREVNESSRGVRYGPSEGNLDTVFGYRFHKETVGLANRKKTKQLLHNVALTCFNNQIKVVGH